MFLSGLKWWTEPTHQHCRPWSQTARETWIAALNVITKIFLNSESHKKCWVWLKSQLLDSAQVGGGQTFNSAKDVNTVDRQRKALLQLLDSWGPHERILKGDKMAI